MFSALRNEVDDRLFVVKQSLTALARIEADVSFPSEVGRTYKGLIFVQLYAAYEYCVNASVQATVRAVNSGNFSHRELRHSLLPLVLDDLCRSLTECGPHRTWSVRLQLMEKTRSAAVAQVAETLFPADGTHYRIGQLETIWSLFGVAEPYVPDNRFIGRIEEVVELRNAIAHGRTRAEDIGARFSISDLESRYDDMRELCQHVIGVLENHVSEPVRLRA